jgi:tetratricopeptide (TPR) repeat protein
VCSSDLAAIKFYERYEKAYKINSETHNDSRKKISYEYLKMALCLQSPEAKHKALKNAIRIYPNNREAYFEEAALYFAEGNIHEGMALIKTFAQNNIGKTIEDTRRLSDAFYHHATMDELVEIMAKHVADESENPLPYLFLSNVYKKRGNIERAKDILRQYLLEFKTKAVVVRAFAHLAEDPVLLRVAIYEDNYKCSECGKRYVEFVEVCTNCGGIDTLNYY